MANPQNIGASTRRSNKSKSGSFKKVSSTRADGFSVFMQNIHQFAEDAKRTIEPAPVLEKRKPRTRHDLSFFKTGGFGRDDNYWDIPRTGPQSGFEAGISCFQEVLELAQTDWKEARAYCTWLIWDEPRFDRSKAEEAGFISALATAAFSDCANPKRPSA